MVADVLLVLEVGVKPSKRNSAASVPGTGQPSRPSQCICPNMRAKVVLPPWFGPEITKARSGPDSSKSLVTTGCFSPASLRASAMSKAPAASIAFEDGDNAG